MIVKIAVTSVFLGGAALAAEEADSSKAARIPACMVIDDGAPFFKDIPTSFYQEFGEWAKKSGVKGKMSVIPCWSTPIDGSAEEYPGHTRKERLEWIEMIKTVYMPRWTITPEVVTHGVPWDSKQKKRRFDLPQENVWLAAQPIEVQAEYIAEGMRMLKNVGIEAGGLTICWTYPKEKNDVLGEATLRAAEKVFGLKFVMVFNDMGDKPALIYRRGDGAAAVSIRPSIGDFSFAEHSSGKMTEKDVKLDADKYITEDGAGGAFVEQIKKGECLIFITHVQVLYGCGTESGFKVFEIAIERLNRHYGDKLEWMTGAEICRRFATDRTSR
jgi:hypothetical protein